LHPPSLKDPIESAVSCGGGSSRVDLELPGWFSITGAIWALKACSTTNPEGATDMEGTEMEETGDMEETGAGLGYDLDLLDRLGKSDAFHR
jgi:hypothetical protein